jgi:hypothetical protein
MRTEFEKMQLVNKAIAEDEQMIVLYKEKQKLLNHLTPKYVWDKETNTMTGYFDEETTKKLDQIALLVEQRIEQIKKHYA